MSKIERIKSWQEEEITKDFFECVQSLIDDSDLNVHSSLEKGELNTAMLFNAGMTQLKEVLEIPEILIDNIREKDEN